MSGALFCYRPHVQGPEVVTTPDLLLDHVQIGRSKLGGERILSIGTVTSSPDLSLASAVALTGADYGPILAPAVVIRHNGVPMSIVLGRRACRRDDLIGRWHSISAGGSPLAENIMRALPPRGFLLAQQVTESAPAVPGVYETRIIDGDKQYELILKVTE